MKSISDRRKSWEPLALTRSGWVRIANRNKQSIPDIPREKPRRIVNSWGVTRVWGAQITYSDLAVYYVLAILSREQGFDNVHTTRYEILKILRKAHSNSNYKALLDSLDRITNCHFEVRLEKDGKRYRYRSLIVKRLIVGEQTGVIDVELDELFQQQNEITPIDFELYNSMSSEGAKAVVRFLMSQEPFLKMGKYRIGREKYQAALGLSHIDPAKFRARVKKYHQDVRIDQRKMNYNFLKQARYNRSKDMYDFLSEPAIILEHNNPEKAKRKTKKKTGPANKPRLTRKSKPITKKIARSASTKPKKPRQDVDAENSFDWFPAQLTDAILAHKQGKELTRGQLMKVRYQGYEVDDLRQFHHHVGE